MNLLGSSQDRIAREIERWKQINADESVGIVPAPALCAARFRAVATYISGRPVLAWGKPRMTG